MVSIVPAFLADGRPFFYPDKFKSENVLFRLPRPRCDPKPSQSMCITLVVATTFPGDLSSPRVTTADLDWGAIRTLADSLRSSQSA